MSKILETESECFSLYGRAKNFLNLVGLECLSDQINLLKIKEIGVKRGPRIGSQSQLFDSKKRF